MAAQLDLRVDAAVHVEHTIGSAVREVSRAIDAPQRWVLGESLRRQLGTLVIIAGEGDATEAQLTGLAVGNLPQRIVEHPGGDTGDRSAYRDFATGADPRAQRSHRAFGGSVAILQPT